MNTLYKIFLPVLLALSMATPIAASDGRFTDPVPEVTRFTIENDPGGIVQEFQEAIKWMKESGNGIRLNGFCASACTLLMDESLEMDICVTEKASLGIHKPYMARAGFFIVRTIPAIYRSELLWQKEFYKKYPNWLQEFIDNNGGAPSVYTGSATTDILTVGYDILRQHFPICKKESADGTAG